VWEQFAAYVGRVWGSTLPNRLGWAIAIAIVFELIIWLWGRYLRRALQPVLQRDLYLEATERVLRRKVLLMLPLHLIHTGLFVVGVLVILRYLGFNTAAEVIPLLLGLVALAALAGWQVLRDMVAGYFLMYDDLCATGDRVTIGEHTGTVTAMGLRYLRLQGQDGREVCLANSEVRALVNHTRTREIQRKAQTL
jgi:small conductance mechanosensitive channel